MSTARELREKNAEIRGNILLPNAAFDVQVVKLKYF